MVEYVFQIGKYGAFELKQKFRKYTSWGLLFAAIVHFAVVGIYWGSIYLAKEEPPERVIRIVQYSELGPPPSITGASSSVAPKVNVAGPQAKPHIGIPVPVPDAEVNPEETFATQEELSQAPSPVSEFGGTGDGTFIEQDIHIDDIPPPDFVPFEKAPQVVKRVEPVYPELARRSGLTGVVWVKIWVDKEGRVRDVVIQKSDSEIFNQPVLDACKQWTFTPALTSTGPVAVWVATNFAFKFDK
jgi:TonB family protein